MAPSIHYSLRRLSFAERGGTRGVGTLGRAPELSPRALQGPPPPWDLHGPCSEWFHYCSTCSGVTGSGYFLTGCSFALNIIVNRGADWDFGGFLGLPVSVDGGRTCPSQAAVYSSAIEEAAGCQECIRWLLYLVLDAADPGGEKRTYFLQQQLTISLFLYSSIFPGEIFSQLLA